MGIIRRCDETGKRENKGEDECKGVTGVKRQMRGGGGGNLWGEQRTKIDAKEG